MFEILDIYDENRKKTGKTLARKEGNVLEKNEFIIAVQCWIINLSGKILITQRKLNKTHGGMWEATSGLVQTGETSIEGIKRELNEEIGIDIKESELRLFKTDIEKGKEVNIHRDVYVINKDIPIEDIKFNDGEVINAKYVTIEQFKKMIKTGEAFEWLSWFVKEYSNMKQV